MNKCTDAALPDVQSTAAETDNSLQAEAQAGMQEQVDRSKSTKTDASVDALLGECSIDESAATSTEASADAPLQLPTMTFEDVKVQTSKSGKEQLVVHYGSSGDKRSETVIAEDGRLYTTNYGENEELASVEMEHTDGSLTQLNFDDKAGIATGHRVDSLGNVIESVTLQEDKLIYVDLKTGTQRAEKIFEAEGEYDIPKFVEGTYDRNTGKFTYEKDGVTTTESFAPGRDDRVQKDGSILGETITGERSELHPDGEASVFHADGSGVTLNADNTIDRWKPNSKDTIVAEALTPYELKFVTEHPDVDRRDIAEVHRRLSGDMSELDRFYKELGTIDSANNLNTQEKSALRNSIIRHVAYPGEIYQGRSPSCNVTVVQRDIAMTRPDLYAMQVVRAVSEGTVLTAEGKRVQLSPDNLKMHDSSGRDLASRIYQTAALAVEFEPRAKYENTEDGVGKLQIGDESVAFDGLNLAQIADVRFKLTGEERALAFVDNAAELKAAFKANGGDPIILGVDGKAAPFEGAGPVGSGTGGVNHVATLIGITEGKDSRAQVFNQWGLEYDHAGKDTTISTKDLFENMRFRDAIDGPGPALVITKGDHRRGYQVENGKLVLDPSLTAHIQEGVAMLPKR